MKDKENQATLRRLRLPHSPQPSALAALEAIAEECGGRNWNGFDAAPVSGSTINRVGKFLAELPPSMTPSDITPEADGAISVDWLYARYQVFSVSIEESDEVHYAGLCGKGVEICGTARFANKIPKVVLQEIRTLKRLSCTG